MDIAIKLQSSLNQSFYPIHICNQFNSSKRGKFSYYLEQDFKWLMSVYSALIVINRFKYSVWVRSTKVIPFRSNQFNKTLSGLVNIWNMTYNWPMSVYSALTHFEPGFKKSTLPQTKYQIPKYWKNKNKCLLIQF